MYFFVENILSVFVIFDKIYNYSLNMVYDYFDTVTIYTITHDLAYPFKKVYSFIFSPLLISYDNKTYKFILLYTLPNRSTTNFYEKCIIKDRSLKYFFSNTHSIKHTNDFTKSKQLSIQVHDRVLNHLQNMYFDFTFTANHICVIMSELLGTDVQSIDENLDEFTFKDTDIIN